MKSIAVPRSIHVSDKVFLYFKMEWLVYNDFFFLQLFCTAGEDVEIGRCLINYLGINFTDTRDSLGRERFIPFAPGTILTREINEKDWYYMFNTEWGLKSGKDCCAPDSVSFHYLKKAAMVRHVQALLYFCNDD
jgi:hypothetical protein